VSASQLVSIDAGTAAATRIGAPLVGREIRGAMFDGLDRLWVIDRANNELLRIDPATGAPVGAPVPL